MRQKHGMFCLGYEFFLVHYCYMHISHLYIARTGSLIHEYMGVLCMDAHKHNTCACTHACVHCKRMCAHKPTHDMHACARVHTHTHLPFIFQIKSHQPIHIVIIIVVVVLQIEIARRLNEICAQVIPFLSTEVCGFKAIWFNLNTPFFLLLSFLFAASATGCRSCGAS